MKAEMMFNITTELRSRVEAYMEAEGGFSSLAEAIRDLIRQALRQYELETGEEAEAA